ncbi:Rrf2 family transcriptional regulator [uncultured Maritalea sp.]|uniref:RrF2 family transcriptional regulator n=1 Tax=Maritalea porphyrae TaxID=880732 RepID=UPI0022C816A5|nr:Rrf2 family transcriptional regulator [Maritalea porphyrae]
MHLTSQTDYALRLVIYLGALSPQKRTIAQIADQLQISRTHLMKIVNRLTNAQILHSVRGKNGGVAINPNAYSITIAEIVGYTEPNFAIVECLNKEECSCVFAGYCSLTSFFTDAKAVFIEHLRTKTLGDVIKENSVLPPSLN